MVFLHIKQMILDELNFCKIKNKEGNVFLSAQIYLFWSRVKIFRAHYFF